MAKRSNGVVLWSRRGNGFTARFPQIARACENLQPDTLIDAEVVAIDDSGRVSFDALQHGRPRAHIQFYAFDVLVHRCRNVLRLPLEQRRELLAVALAKIEYPVIHFTPFDAKPAELIRAAKELELEGIIAKRKGSLYEPGRRSGAWVKYKLNRSQEFVIGGYTAGNPFDALIVDCYEEAQGLCAAHALRVVPAAQGTPTDKCPFADLPEKRRTLYLLTRDEMQNCQWLKPLLVTQVEFTEWTPDGHLRHSSFAGLRDDKVPRWIVRE